MNKYNITAVIAEYNPFHNGHKYHIETSKEQTNSDFTIAIMSSSFVQRGDCAVYDKWTRTKAALSCGVDVLIELPIMYSTSSAENFARGAVKIINSMGIVNNIAFGAETDRIELLEKTAEFINSPTKEFTSLLKSELNKGSSFPAARATAMSLVDPSCAKTLNSPNNILAIEYIKALKLFNSNIQPCLIHRKHSEFNSQEISGDISSATAVRKALINSEIDSVRQTVPLKCFEIYSSNHPVFANDFSSALSYILRTMTLNDLKNISGVSEGLENRILRTVGEFTNISDICSSLKTKRYTYTRIMRTLFHILLGIKSEHETLFSPLTFDPYIRVLGFKKSAEPLITELVKNSSLQIIMNVNKDEYKLSANQHLLLNLEKNATNLYFMPLNGNLGLDYTMPIIIEKDK